MLRKPRKALALLLITAVAFSPVLCLTPAGGQNQESKVEKISSEVFDLTTDHTGKVKQGRLVQFFRLRGSGTVDVVKDNTYRSEGMRWQGVREFNRPVSEGGKLVWRDIEVDGNRNVVSIATLGEEQVKETKMRIPLDIKYRYWLDGVEVKDPADIAGKDGHFKLSLTVKNTSKEKTEVTYEDPETGEMVTEEVETHLPLVILPYGWSFDSSVFFNIKTDPTGAVVHLPDSYALGWSIPLFPPATEDTNTIWLEADVKDLSLPPLVLSANFFFPETNQANPVPEFKAGLEELYAGVLQLDSGLEEAVAGLGSAETSDTLIYGTSAILDGLKQMGDPARGLPSAKGEIDSKMIPGVEEAVSGIGSEGTTDTLLYAVDRTTEGIEQIKAGIGDAASAKSLLGGLFQMAAGLEQIKAGIGSKETPDTLLFAADQVGGGLQRIVEGIGSPDKGGTLLYGMSRLKGGLEQMKAGIGSASTGDSLLYAMSAMASGLEQSKQGIGSARTPDTLLYAMAAMSSGLNEMLAGIGGAGVPDTLLFAVNEITVGLNKIKGGCTPLDFSLRYAMSIVGSLKNQIEKHMPEPYRSWTLHWINDPQVGLMDLLKAANEGVLEIWKGLGSAGTPGTLLYGMDQVRYGLESIKEGIRSSTGGASLLYAVEQVQGGLELMRAGTGNATSPDTLLYAIARVQAGLNEMKAGIGSETAGDTLLNGIAQIERGLRDMKAGIGTPTQEDTLAYGVSAIAGGLEEIKVGIGDAAAADTLLGGISQLQAGLEEMKAGIGEAEMSDTLLYALAQIQGGLHRLSEGLKTGDLDDPGLVEGLVLLSSGLGEAVAGLGTPRTPDTLIYGASEINEGAGVLQSGLSMAVNEGTRVMAEGLGESLAELNLTLGKLEAIKKRGEEFDHILGRAEDAENILGFIFETPAVPSYKGGSSSMVAALLSLILIVALTGVGVFWRVRARRRRI